MSAAAEHLLSNNNNAHKHDVHVKDAWKARTLEDYQKLLHSQANRPLKAVDLSVVTLGVCARLLPALVLIWRLPNEILFHTFGFLLSMRDTASMQSYDAISRVCRKWRDITKAFRRPPPALYIAHKILSSDTCTWTSKDNTPFALSIPGISSDSHAHSSDGLRHLPGSDCMALSLSYRPSNRWFPMSPVPTSSWTLLQTLKISIPAPPEPYDLQSHLFATAVNLTDVEIDCGSDVLIYLPMGRLERYREHSFSHANNIYALNSSPRLQFVDYTISHASYLDYLRAKWQYCRMTFPVLTHFDFKVYAWSRERFYVVDNIALPNVTKLRVRIMDNVTKSLKAMLHNSAEHVLRSKTQIWPPSPYPGIINAQLKRQLQLTHLAFSSETPLEEGEILDLLSYAPWLTYLECGSIPTSDLGVLGLPTLNREGTCIAPRLTTLVVHDPASVEPYATLAKSNYLPRRPYRTLLKIKLLYHRSEIRRTHGICLGVSNPDDETYDFLEDLGDDLIKIALQPASRDVRFSLKHLQRALDPILKSLECWEGLSPESVPLSLIQALYALNRVESRMLDDSEYKNSALQRRVMQIYAKLLIIYQLKTWTGPAWVAPGHHCLVFDYESRLGREWRPDQPSEYDLLYGRFSPPSEEQIMWPYKDCYEFRDGFQFFGGDSTFGGSLNQLMCRRSD
ncbi:hypothetical protein BJ165DRAFT_559654 [Panaeolus papilionaceus]|nr:hypothetical protein BJ165DRAFT_559654 [Panaeolus papilionaceus]